MQVIAGNKNWATLVAGINGEYLVAREWHIASGRSFTTNELESGAKVAVVGSVIADELFSGSTGVGERLRIGNVPFTVIGTLEQKGQGAAGRSQDDVVFVPLSAAKSRVPGAVRGTSRNAMDFIMIKASDQMAIPEMKSELTSLLRVRHHLRQDALELECVAQGVLTRPSPWRASSSPSAEMMRAPHASASSGSRAAPPTMSVIAGSVFLGAPDHPPRGPVPQDRRTPEHLGDHGFDRPPSAPRAAAPRNMARGPFGRL